MKHLDEGRLRAWLDRPRSGLGPEEAREIGAHLEACGACARRLAELEDLDARAASILSGVEPGDADAPPFREVVERSRRAGGEHASPSPRVALGWAASVVLALGVGWMANEIRSGRQVAREPEPVAVLEAPSDVGGAGTVGAEAGPDTVGRVAGADVERTRGESRANAAERRQAASRAAPAEAGGDGGAPAEDRAATPEPVQELRVAEVPARSRPRTSDEVADRAAPAEETAAADRAARPDPGVTTGRGARIVQGRVTDEEGRPLASARVAVLAADAGALTDEDGSYVVRVPRELASVDSTFTVTASRIGRATSARRIALAGDTVTADFRLADRRVALQELVVTGAEPTEERGHDDAPDWRALSPAAAEAEAGFPAPLVPGLEILAVEIGALDGGPAVRVRQRVGPGTVLTLLRRRAAGVVEAEDSPDFLTTVSIRRDGLLLTATAPLPADSLRVLVERVR